MPTNIQMETLDQKHRFIESYSFGVVVDAEFRATHIPLLLNKDEGEFGTLYGHFSRKNPHSLNLDGTDVLVIFSGPHAYISPSWYLQRPAVPTWNYATVHVRGKVALLDDSQAIGLLQRTTDQYEPGLMNADEIMPLEFLSKLSAAVTCFKIEISVIEGKLKLGQHRSRDDQQSVMESLKKSSYAEARELASFMTAWSLGTGG